MKVERDYISAWYGQTKGTSWAEARYLLHTLKRGKHLKVMSLPPTTPNLFLHILQVDHAIMIGEAVDQQSPPHIHFAKFVWDINGDFLILANANQLTEPPELIQIIACKLHSNRNNLQHKICSCNCEGISCTAQSFWYIFP